MALWLLMLAYAAAFFVLCWRRYATFHAQIDLSYYLRLVWGLGHGHPDLPLVRSPYFLGLHLEPVLFPLAALGALGVPLVPLLLGVQAAAVAALAWPAWRLGARHLGGYGGPGAALFALLYPTVTVATLHDFHPVTLAIAPLLGVIDALDEGATSRALGLGALALCCREDIALQLALLCGFCAWRARGRARQGWLALGALLGAGFLYYVGAVQPRWPSGLSSYPMHFAGLGAHSGRDLLRLIWHDPGRVLRHLATWDRLLYPWHLLWPAALLPLLCPWPLLGAVPVAFINLLSDFARVRTIESHYTTAIAPFVIGAAILGAGRLIAWLRGRGAAVVLGALLGVVAAAHVFHGATPLAWRSERWDPAHFRDGPHAAAIRNAVRAVPPGASVAARPGPLAHLAQRPRILSPPEYADGGPVDVRLLVE